MTDELDVDGNPVPAIVASGLSLQALDDIRVEGNAQPAYALQFDIHARLKEAVREYEGGKALLKELDDEQGAFNRVMNEKRQALARGIVRLEGVISVLTEQGAKHE